MIDIIEQKPFRKYNVGAEPRDQIVLRINPELRKLIDEHKSALQEPKDATVVKQLVVLGANALQSSFAGALRNILFKNKKRNERYGWVEIE